jgi:dienelactone hydrolase
MHREDAADTPAPRGAQGLLAAVKLILPAVFLAALVAIAASLSDEATGRAPGWRAEPPDPGTPGPFGVGVTARAASRPLPDGQVRVIPVDLWYPAKSDPQRLVKGSMLGALNAPPAARSRRPLVVFSSGGGAPPRPYAFLLAHLASHGFVVAAPHHQDCTTCTPRYDAYLTEDVRRVGDVSAVIDALAALSAGGDPLLAGMVDATKVGVVGHSQGGHTALAVQEADPRVLASVGLAPAVIMPPPNAPDAIVRPTMLVLGEWDNRAPYGIGTRFFERIPPSAPDRWLLSLRRAGHSFWNECGDGMREQNAVAYRTCAEMLPQAEINAITAHWTTAFLARFVAGDARYDALLDPAQTRSDDYGVVRVLAGATSAPVPSPTPLPGGNAVVAQATDLLCRSGRTVACDALRSGKVTAQFGPLQASLRSEGYIPTPSVLTLDAPYGEGPVAEVAALLVGAATHAVTTDGEVLSCTAIARAETEQALFWQSLYPRGDYPTGSPRARRML